MTRTRTRKEKIAPLAGHAKKMTSALMAFETASTALHARQGAGGQGTLKVKEKERVPCPECPNPGTVTFTRPADLKRHIRSIHLDVRPFPCTWPDCTHIPFKSTASRESHIASKHLKLKPRRCDIAMKSGVPCGKAFYDDSSLDRHRKEQHGKYIHQCPYCASGARKQARPTRIKRRAEFIKHLWKKHGIHERDVTKYLVPRESDVDLGPPVPGPSKAKATDSRKRHASPAPCGAPLGPSQGGISYDGVPLIVTPRDDSYASTPGLSFGSPSPSPAPEVACERRDEIIIPSTTHNALAAPAGT
ncbi:hypothetical protein OH77DRAFT_655922 [Trametes cingulata]|nr:hypothetical protein OH77DRAFT_655922 [Trametes cingulata]